MHLWSKFFKSENANAYHLFIHIFTVTARSDHLVNQCTDQLVFFYAAQLFSKILHWCSLQICWCADGDHISSWASHIAYIGFKNNSPVVKDLANIVANDVACYERWFDKHYAVTWHLASSCWNQYSFLVAIWWTFCHTVSFKNFSR